MLEGAAAPSNEIRSGDMRGARSGCKPLLLSFSGRAHSAQENDVFMILTAESCRQDKKTPGCVRQSGEFELLN